MAPSPGCAETHKLSGYFSAHGHIHEHALSGFVDAERFSLGVNLRYYPLGHLVWVFLNEVPPSAVNLLDILEQVIGADIFVDGREA